jgi:ubiquinone/menaquinone biosynthesis C-methylase UbiE
MKHIANTVNCCTEKNGQLQILELGAGTGKFTESFINFYLEKHNSELFSKIENLKYLATEPSDGFRHVITDKKLSNVSTKQGTGSEIPMKSKSADAIIAAQAFHWMATETTVLEIHRVLKPKKPLILIWNTNSCTSWWRTIEMEILSPLYIELETPRQQSGEWKNCFQTSKTTDLFSSLQKWKNVNNNFTQNGNRQMVIDRMMSISVIASTEAKRKEEILNKIEFVLDSHPDLEIARKANNYVLNYDVDLYWTFSI